MSLPEDCSRSPTSPRPVPSPPPAVPVADAASWIPRLRGQRLRVGVLFAAIAGLPAA
ncbi:hypothetical protein [Streptomyces sp. NL15-2K]|uniref:hypothetical protein n=1 Tax=Streptomyces sp. NL15-2K TaxID=376149 RepID=UPI000FFAEB8E|nr:MULTISPECIES: hypothetical protein [Actinomycetes]WKX09296.1 hypothetical protein Q4V64_18070 [Kutzneria buriramensis]GCB49211.1 hypothetical protein SNL152K_6545 [Streptomyces sp. NL15-2K]